MLTILICSIISTVVFGIVNLVIGADALRDGHPGIFVGILIWVILTNAITISCLCWYLTHGGA